MQELDEILKNEEPAKQEIDTPTPALKEEKKPEDEVLKKQEQLQNLEKAIAEANAELKKTREVKKQVIEEEIPKIDFNDPSSKAWDKHIRENVSPLQVEMEKEKEEIRNFALREFMEDKPALARNPEKIKELVGVYDKIKTASERTKEGVLNDLNKAFAVVYSEELMSSAREARVNKAQGDAMFSEAGVSRGSTAYFKEKEADPSQNLSEDDKAILARWGMSSQEWGEAKKKYQ